MKKIALAGLILFTTSPIWAQLEGGAFTETGRGASTAFVTDYQALGINPANIAFGNEYNKKFTFSLMQFSTSIYSEGIAKPEFKDAMFGVDDKISVDDQFNASTDFENTAMSLDLTTTLFGFAVNTEKAGNFAFSINMKANYFSVFNDEGSAHLWRGYVDPYFDQWIVEDEFGNEQTIANEGPDSDRIDDVIKGFSTNPKNGSELYNGTVLRTMSYMEYNVGYGRHVYENEDMSVYAGVGVKYLQGLYVMNLTIEDNEVKEAYTASTPSLGIDYGSGALTNPSTVEGSGFQPVGTGFGFDLGVAIELNDQFRVSASVTDIGSLTFDGNVYNTSDTLIYDIETIGIESYNVFTEFDVFAGDDGLFDWVGQEEKKVTLATQARLGIAYFHNEKLRLGLDMAVPLNDEPGNLDRFAFAMGGEYLATQVIRVSAGVGAGDNYAFRVPVGLNFVTGGGTWEFGVSTRDVLYFFKDEKPNLSLAAGFLRFRFGEMETGTTSRMYN